MKIVAKVTRKIITGVRLIIQNSVRVIAAFSWTRWWLNAIYLKLTPYQRSLFYQEFAKIFRNSYIRGSDGIWKVFFVNKKILMPLTAENFYLEWDSAISIVGHDLEVKQTYESLIGSSEKPELFIDIGASYGTHSLLFLVNDIKTITFEPNTSCHNYFKKICKLNNVTSILEPVALGDRVGYVELSYPKHDTWLGSTNAEVINNLSLSHELVTKKVKQKMIDNYFSKVSNNRTLIKIDTEGNELSVLRGAIITLQENKPMIIFECFGDSGRAGIFDYFNSQNYSIYYLPWSPTYKADSLTFDQFIVSSSTNFIAVPIST
jgi:FkbM family methyltransferase